MSALMDKLVKNANKLWKYETSIAATFLFVNVCFIIANIIMRRFFNAPIFGSTEMIRYISLVAASFSIAQNEWINGNITMTLIHEKLKAKAAAMLSSITNSVVALIFVVITYLLWTEMMNKFAKDDVSYELQFPMWIPALILAIGFTLLTCSIVIKAVLLWYVEVTGAPTIDFRGMVVPKEQQAIEN